MLIEFSTQTWMLLFFIVFLAISLLKISAFFSNKPLEDDDTTTQASQILEQIMLDVIVQNGGEITHKELFMQIKQHKDFDNKRFWRFNENRLRHMLEYYYAKNQKVTTITELYKELKC